jgi:saccharopine dehydrogenase-like NADP-dependent oxidoreductase
MGFASEKPIKIKDVEVVPKDVLFALIPQPADVYIESLAKQENEKRSTFKRDALICYLAEIMGKKNGKAITRTFYRISSSLELFNRYGTPWAEVAIPVSLTATMLASGEIEAGGIVPPEGLDPEKFLKRLAEWGITFKEKL